MVEAALRDPESVSEVCLSLEPLWLIASEDASVSVTTQNTRRTTAKSKAVVPIENSRVFGLIMEPPARLASCRPTFRFSRRLVLANLAPPENACAAKSRQHTRAEGGRLRAAVGRAPKNRAAACCRLHPIRMANHPVSQKEMPYDIT